MKKSEIENEVSFLVSSVIGTRDDVERLLLAKGLSQLTASKIINKIEILIALSGELGKLLQREKDLNELRLFKAELRKFKNGEI